MRNLGLALLFGAMIIAPHAVHAKKHVAKKPSKTGKRSAPSTTRAAAHVAPSDNLAHAVSEKRAAPQPVMTSSSAVAAPAPANAPMNMQNQDLDEEVPGAKHKK
jgi:hypothetical protein